MVPRRERPLVLVAETADARPLRRTLEAFFDVVSARTGPRAQALCDELSPDAVVVEAELPNDEAANLALRIVRAAGAERPPLFVLARPYDDADAVRYLDLGVADYLPREVSVRELVARVEKALRETRQRQDLVSLSRTDALTGLANFRALMQRVEEELQRASRYQYPLAAVMIDLDHLKRINDEFGHESGNRSILALTRTLRAGLRQADFAARYGGDEFVILLPHQTPQEAQVMVERLRGHLGEAQVRGPDGRALPLRLTLSAGIAGHTVEAPRQSAEGLLQLADGALYQAKRTGRDKVVVGTRPDRAAAHTRH